jgi:hypothetical protein
MEAVALWRSVSRIPAGHTTFLCLDSRPERRTRACSVLCCGDALAMVWDVEIDPKLRIHSVPSRGVKQDRRSASSAKEQPFQALILQQASPGGRPDGKNSGSMLLRLSDPLLCFMSWPQCSRETNVQRAPPRRCENALEAHADKGDVHG